MKKNIGKFDSTFRIIVALVIGILYATSVIHGTLALVLLAVAAVFLLTGFTGVCPLYMLFGIRTRGQKQTER